ncbi:unspecified product [Plasmodium ovale curtisi]|uniref:Unspecified product n=1 Tax=Plasmodium ovale curtisi TaxID=864141 RepID=A0A1A8WNB8_PLAOA|nr:unspecified product [Plasmodium ovale curtisi]
MSLDTEYAEFWNSIKENTFTKNETLEDIYTKLEKMCSEDKNKNYCIIDSDQYNDCDNVKKFYHKLYGNYDAAQKKSSINDKICESKYKTTLNNMISLYNDRNTYCANQSNEYCNEFKEYNEIYMVKKLCKLQCNNEGSHILEEALSVCSEADSSSQHFSRQDPPGGKLDRYTTPVLGENNSVEITMTVIPTFLTLRVIFPILYRLTTFGTLLHKFIIKTKRFLHDTNEYQKAHYWTIYQNEIVKILWKDYII